MDIDNLLYIYTREEWRNWLEAHFDQKKEVWLVYPNKFSGKQRLQYNDAVEEALCFGWIDSTVKSLDSMHSMQRFTPRRKGSSYSQPNIERLKWLTDHNMIHPAVQPVIAGIINKKFIFSEDILEILKRDKKTWSNFQLFSDSYKRIRIAYIDDSRKRPDEFQKRLSNFIKKTKQNKLIGGYGGIDKYY